MGKQWKIWVERLENWLKREEKRWKEWGEGKMMPSKIEAPMWDHYCVKHAWNNGKTCFFPKTEPMQHHAVITMWFAASTRKFAPIYAQNSARILDNNNHAAIPMRSASGDSKYDYTHTRRPKAASSHHYTTAKKKSSRNRRAIEVPFIAGCSHFIRKYTRFRTLASSPIHHLPSSPLPFLITSHRYHLASSPLPFLTTSHRHHIPSSPPPFVHFPSSPLPFLTTPLHHHFTSSPPPFVHFPPHHFLSSPLPFLTAPLHHHFPSSPLPIVPTSLPHHFPSSSLFFVTTRHYHHSSSKSIPPLLIFILYIFIWSITLHHFKY